MKKFFIFVIGFLTLISCSEKAAPVVEAIESNKQRVVVAEKLGEGKYYKDFIASIKNKDCKSIQNVSDDTVYFSAGERTNAIFRRKNGFLEDKHKFSLCDLFFDTKIMQRKIAVLFETEELEPSFISPLEWLNKSKKISFLAMEATSDGDEVNVAFLGGRYFYPEEPYRNSRDLDFLFRCPNGFQKKCYLYSYTAY